MKRREFLYWSASLGGILATSGTMLALSDNNTFEIVPSFITVTSQNLPHDFDGYRIGFISDIHLGRCVPRSTLAECVAFFEKNSVDMLLLGGDFIWSAEGLPTQASLSARTMQWCFDSNETYADSLFAEIADAFRHITIPDGRFAVLGNHDRWIATEATARHMEQQGTVLLVNQYAIVQRPSGALRLVGVDDFWTGIPHIPAELPSEDPNEFRIILSHNPDFLSETLQAQKFKFDLGLAGHTHGGQVKLPLLGAPFYNVHDRRFAEGLVQFNNTAVFTTRGVGVAWFPVRLNCPPEVSIITLKVGQ